MTSENLIEFSLGKKEMLSNKQWSDMLIRLSRAVNKTNKNYLTVFYQLLISRYQPAINWFFNSYYKEFV